MKTKAFIIIISIFISAVNVSLAQSSSDKDETNAKAAKAVERLTEAFKFEKEKQAVLKEIFSDFYDGQQKLKNNIQRPASGLTQRLASQDFQSVRKRNEALITEREKRLKKELTEEQYKKWKGSIEPSLHKRR